MSHGAKDDSMTNNRDNPMDTVGTSPIRVDGVDKVRGAARYIDDIDYPGMLYGATVRTRNAPAARWADCVSQRTSTGPMW